MAVYRELFLNNVEDFMASSFPVLKTVLGKDRWQSLVQEYFAEHRAETPLFPQLPTEFLKYLNDTRRQRADYPPFMPELAHYEWMELAAAQSDTLINWDLIDKDGDLLNGHPVVSPLAWILSYQYPVHQIGKDFIPRQKGEHLTHIIVYRDYDDEVGFIEINPTTAILVNRLDQAPELSGRHALEQLAAEMNHPQPQVVINGGLETLRNLRAYDIILGTRKT